MKSINANVYQYRPTRKNTSLRAFKFFLKLIAVLGPLYTSDGTSAEQEQNFVRRWLHFIFAQRSQKYSNLCTYLFSKICVDFGYPVKKTAVYNFWQTYAWGTRDLILHFRTHHFATIEKHISATRFKL